MAQIVVNTQSVIQYFVTWNWTKAYGLHMIFLMYRVVLQCGNTMGQIFAHTHDISNVSGCMNIVVILLYKSLHTSMIFRMYRVVLHDYNIIEQIFVYLYICISRYLLLI